MPAPKPLAPFFPSFFFFETLFTAAAALPSPLSFLLYSPLEDLQQRS